MICYERIENPKDEKAKAPSGEGTHVATMVGT